MKTRLATFSATWWCVWYLSAVAHGDIRLPPMIEEEFTEKILKDNKTLTYSPEATEKLACVASGYPPPTYTWLKDGKLLDLNGGLGIHLSAGMLSFTVMDSRHEGFYQCRAKNKYGTALSNIVYLQRARALQFEGSDITSHSPYVGDSLKLSCKYPGSVPPPTYEWSKVDQAGTIITTIERDIRINLDDKGDLYFAEVKETDSLNGYLYQCSAYNPFAKTTNHGSLCKVTVRTDSPVGNRPPVIKFKSPSQTTALLGTDLTLQCIFSAKPIDRMVITWTKVGGDLPSNRYEQKPTTLTLQALQKDDEGTYQCSAHNDEGDNSGAVRMDVLVQSYPDFKTGIRPKNQNVTEGEAAIFICDPSADPPAAVRWMVNGDPLTCDPECSTTNGINELRFPRMSLSPDHKNLTVTRTCKDCEAGGSDLMGLQCNGSNQHGYAMASVYLNVLERTEIEDGPESQTLVYHEPVIFDCVARSDESTPVTVDWLLNRETIHYMPGHRELLLNGSLYMPMKDLVDGGASLVGNYTCLATNGYSRDEFTAELRMSNGTAPIRPITTTGASVPWWIYVVAALLALLIVVLIVLCCCWCRRQREKGEEYDVDAAERSRGCFPEKKMAEMGFTEYQRPEQAKRKGSRASFGSMSSALLGSQYAASHLGGSYAGSLADMDKFNEDGSYIGAYDTLIVPGTVPRKNSRGWVLEQPHLAY